METPGPGTHETLRTRLVVGAIAGLTSAVLFVAASPGNMLTMMLFWVAPLPLFIAGLGWGLQATAIGALLGMGLLSLLAGVTGGVIFGMLCAVAPVFLVRAALLSRDAGSDDGYTAERQVEWYPAGRLMTWLSGLAVLGFLIPHLVLWGSGGLPGALLSQISPSGVERAADAQEADSGTVQPATGTLEDGTGDGLSSPAAANAPGLLAIDTAALQEQLTQAGLNLSAEQVIVLLAQVMPALAGIAWFFMMGGTMLFAQTVVKASGRAIRPEIDVAGTELPPFLTAALVAALVLSAAPGNLGYAGSTAAVLLALPFIILGFVTLHAVTARWVERRGAQGGLKAARTVGLLLFYVLVMIQPVLVLAVFVLGLVDQWMRIRQRGAVTPDGPKD